MSEFTYVGSELDIFEKAKNWKAYFRGIMAPYIHGGVLEVGAGLGANTKIFANLPFETWTCLEPDRALLDRFSGDLPRGREYEVVAGTIQTLAPARKFDVILYIDVLEHIENDRREMELAIARLKPNGVIVVLSPAHQWLFTPFDEAIGHCRRYSRASLAAVGPPGALVERLIYLDSAGMLASLGNRLLLKSRMPTAAQIATWDNLLIPISRRLDKFLNWSVGKTVVAIWRSPAGK